MNVGEKIKFLRTHKGMTQRELADALNIAPTTLQSYESGKREPKPIRSASICQKLGIRPSFLNTESCDSLAVDLFNHYEYGEAVAKLNEALARDEVEKEIQHYEELEERRDIRVSQNPFNDIEVRKYPDNPYILTSASESLHRLIDEALCEINQEGYLKIVNSIYGIMLDSEYRRDGGFLKHKPSEVPDDPDDPKDE